MVESARKTELWEFFRHCVNCGSTIESTEPQNEVVHRHRHRVKDTLYVTYLEVCRRCRDLKNIDNEWVKGFANHLERRYQNAEQGRDQGEQKNVAD